MNTIKVFLACALGAFIGALIALQVNHRIWRVGLFAGFAVGYLAYEFNKIIAAIPHAWRAVSGWRWHPDVTWWRFYPEAFLGGLCLNSTIALGLSTLMFQTGELPFVTWVAMNTVSPFIASVLMCRFAIDTDNPEKTHDILDSMIKKNPFRLYCWVIPRFVFKCIWWLIKGVPAAARFVGTFLWQLFTLTHSEIRLLCGIDAAIGCAVGYFCGSALTGAIVGGLWGVINFEMISIRVLHLVPEDRSLFR